jgi:hypothetical protein
MYEGDDDGDDDDNADAPVVDSNSAVDALLGNSYSWDSCCSSLM